ncbi:MAG: hypothetical protein IT335_13180 [Thermomicrobiales bacterium]|nr:hypothetical protein [Thermomicrobiales bacterium]
MTRSITSRLNRRTVLKTAVAGAGGAAIAGKTFSGSIAAPNVVQSSSELVVGLSSDAVAIDTRQSQNTTGVSQILHVLEPLVSLNTSTGAIESALAESWEPTENGWRLHIRQGVTFHDGQPLTAEDVKYTLDSIIDPANVEWVQPTIRGKLGRLAGVEVEDEYTVALDLGGQSRAFLANLLAVGIIPASAASQGADFAREPVGTGPYRYAEFTSGEQFVVERNGDYWGDAPVSDRIVFRILAENATRVAALESGEVVMIDNLPPDQMDRIGGIDGLSVLTETTSRFMHVQMINDRPPFDDIRVRQAVNHAIDKEAIHQALIGGLGAVQTAPWPANMLGHNDELTPFPYDPDLARQLLNEAGVSDITISFGGPVGRYLNDRQVAEAILTQLQDVGIKAEPDLREFGSFFENVFDRQYDAFLLGYAYGGLDPESGREFWSSGSSLANYSNPEVDQLFDAGDSTTDLDEAAGIYRELSGIIWNDVPYAWLYFQPTIVGVSDRLQGWAPQPDEFIKLAGASVS